MGCSRLSNLDDLANFHLRNKVHKMAMPPTLAAMTMIIVVVVFFEPEPELSSA